MIVPIQNENENKNEDEEVFPCKICLEIEPRSELFTPCNCKGSSAFIHKQCLQTWFKYNHQNIKHCEICNHVYTYQPSDENENLIQLFTNMIIPYNIYTIYWKNAIFIVISTYIFNLFLSNIIIAIFNQVSLNISINNITDKTTIYYVLEDTDHLTDEYLASFILVNDLFAYSSILYSVIFSFIPILITVPLLLRKNTTFCYLWFLSLHSSCKKNGFNLVSIITLTILSTLFAVWPFITLFSLLTFYHTTKNKVIARNAISRYASNYVHDHIEVEPI